jgi:hypothetical protein
VLDSLRSAVPTWYMATSVLGQSRIRCGAPRAAGCRDRGSWRAVREVPPGRGAAGNGGDSGVGVATDIEAVKPGRPGVVEDALHQNLVAHCWLRVVRHLSAGRSSRRAQLSTSRSQHVRAGHIGGRHPKVHMGGGIGSRIGWAVGCGGAAAPAQRSRPSARARAAAWVRLVASSLSRM